MTASLLETLHAPAWHLSGGVRPSFYRRDAVLEVHLPGTDVELRGRDDIVGYLTDRWPDGTRLETLSVRDSTGGTQVRVDVATEDGAAFRERHLLHIRDDAIELHVIYPERVPFAVGDEALTVGPPARLARDRLEKTSLPSGFSGAPLEKIDVGDGRCLIVKHIAPRWSWVMRATHDEGREASLWTEGRRPGAGIETAIVESVRLPDRWLLYMDDVSAFVSVTEQLSLADEVALLGRIAVVSGDPKPVEGLCSLTDRLSLFSPATARRELDGTDLGPKIVGRGWELIRALIPAELFELAHGLASDPGPLARALTGSPSTLLHGDLRPGNFGMQDGRLVVIDWGLASWGPRALDLTWYLFNRGWPAGLEDGLAVVRDVLGNSADGSALDLSVMATFVQVAPYFGFNVVQDPDPTIRTRAARDLAAWVDATGRSLDRCTHLLSS